ncbi:iron chaperone [Streptomyces sp. NPDC059262]|uniref:iron chaperone n=1 Tax=Streptomyces sp. NPDC059262 TaxID=3346797 RepID=UPI003675F68E
MPNTQRTPKSARSTTGAVTADKTYDGFTEEERGAMKERARELKASSRRGSRTAKADGDSEVRAKIAEMSEADRVIAERIHDIVRNSAPELAPKLWYGMPAYAGNGKVVCFFQSAQKFKTRYATLGFSDLAKLDDGTMWPSAYALTELNADDETRIGELIKRAVS